MLRSGVDRRHLLRAAVGAGFGSLASSVIASKSQARKLSALCIGINQYDHISNLERAVADAEAIAERLSAFGYDTTAVVNTPLDHLQDAISQHLASLDESTASFVFIASHALQLAGRNFILPKDQPSLSSADALAGAIQLDFLLESVAIRKPAQSIVVLDACRDPSIGLNVSGYSNGLASTNAPGGTYVVYSASSGEFALDKISDSDCSENGLFTRHFLAEIRPDEPIHRAVVRTRAKVIPDARSTGYSQHPAVYDQSTWEYRLDGKVGSGQAQISQFAGGMEGTSVLIAAQSGICQSEFLGTEGRDAERLRQAFVGLGADAVILPRPSADSLSDALFAMGKDEDRQSIFIWIGSGGLVSREACAFVAKPGECDDPDRTSGFLSPGVLNPAKIDVVTQTEILMSMPHNTANLAIFDIAMIEAQLPEEALPPITGALSDLPFQVERYLPYDDATSNASLARGEGVLTGASLNQNSFVEAPNQTSSPLTIAMLNALARPGLTVSQFAQVVRNEVESLSNFFQTPRLIATPPLLNHVLVQPDLQPSAICES